MKKRSQWRFILPVLQLALAICLWLYTPFQFDNYMLRTMNLSPEQVRGRYLGISAEVHSWYYPPAAGRILYALNLPAHALSSDAFAFITKRIVTPGYQFEIQNEVRGLPMLYTVGVEQIMFAFGILALWFWIGNKIDSAVLKGSAVVKEAPKRSFRVVELIACAALSIYLLQTCLHCLLSPLCSPNWRQMMMFGLLWPLGFFALFCFIVWRGFRMTGLARDPDKD
jgi:hypothetical protein